MKIELGQEFPGYFQPLYPEVNGENRSKNKNGLDK